MHNFVCTICTNRDQVISFPTLSELNNHIQEVHKAQEISVSQKAQVKEERKPVKIELKYKYEGDCPVCKLPLDTIIVKLTTDDIIKAIAYCPSCRTQYEET